MVGQIGFRSHSFYLVLGSHFKWLLRAGDTTELDRDQADTNPSNQPNQPAATCGGTLGDVSDGVPGWWNDRLTHTREETKSAVMDR